jgi:Sensors of blue-light using FAD
MDALINIVYTSRAGDVFRNRDSRLQLKVRAAQYNGKHDITGLLIYSQGTFMQILEGPESAVNALYEDICVDPRHDQVTLITRAMISIRKYAEWSMAVVDTDELANGHMRVDDRLHSVSLLQERAQSSPVSGSTFIEVFLDPTRLIETSMAGGK